MTTALKDTRPFNLEHARAGAPIACKGGDKAVILKWDLRGKGPLLGFVESDGEDIATRWQEDGTTYGKLGDSVALIMIPLGYIDGKPVFVGDEIEMKVFGHLNQWKRVKVGAGWAITWPDDERVAQWPAPAKVYPESTITVHDLEKITPHSHRFYAKWDTECGTSTITYVIHGRCKIDLPLQAIANSALRHAIDAGQVVPTQEANDRIHELNQQISAASTGRAARDMAVAEAVHAACTDVCVENAATLTTNLVRHIDLAAVIAGVAS